MVALNNRNNFLATFRAANPPPEKKDLCVDKEEAAGDEGEVDDESQFDDDIPF